MEELRNSGESQYLTSFYRIIMPSVVRERRLVLPKKFVDEYGEELSRTIRLELPVGDLWHIRVVKSGSLVWLQDGLDKFMKDYSVGFGYFLLFKYRGNREFHLHIFDLTATEIDYRLGLNPKSSWKGFPTDFKTMERENSESPPRKKQKTITNRTDLLLHQKRASRTQMGSATTNKEKKSSNKNSKHSSEGYLEKETDGNKVVETESALDKAKMYRTDNPSWVVQMREYNIRKLVLNFPISFCKENESDYAEDIEMQDSDGNIWHVKCLKYDQRWCLSKGWSQFLKDKGLLVGDVCVFEIMNEGIIKVSIFHAKCDGKVV